MGKLFFTLARGGLNRPQGIFWLALLKIILKKIPYIFLNKAEIQGHDIFKISSMSFINNSLYYENLFLTVPD
jgi:hypothetical protein